MAGTAQLVAQRFSRWCAHFRCPKKGNKQQGESAMNDKTKKGSAARPNVESSGGGVTPQEDHGTSADAAELPEKDADAKPMPTEKVGESVEAEAENKGESEPNEWEKAFEGKTPDEVSQELEDWKKHARQWERRAKANKGEADEEARSELVELTKQAEKWESETNMFRDLIALQFERDVAVPFAEIADSISFQTAYSALDRGSEDFPDRLSELVEARTPKNVQVSHLEVGGAANRGADLYDRLFKNS